MNSLYEQLKKLQQPQGGFINPKTVPYTVIPITKALKEGETVPPYKMLAYLKILFQYIDSNLNTNVFVGTLKNMKNPINQKLGVSIISKITQLTDTDKLNAYYLVDLLFETEEILDETALHTLTDVELYNINIYLERYVDFLKQEEGPYRHNVRYGNTPNVESDVIEFVSKNCLWDFSLSMKVPTKNQFLQLLAQYVIYARTTGVYSVENIGIYNPKINTIYKIPIHTIDENLLNILEEEVLGYEDSKIHTLFLEAKQTPQQKVLDSMNPINEEKNGSTAKPTVKIGTFYKIKKKKHPKIKKIFFWMFDLVVGIFGAILLDEVFFKGQGLSTLYHSAIYPMWQSVVEFMSLGW